MKHFSDVSTRTWMIILAAGFTAALLDAIAAIIFLGARPDTLFKFIAMGLFGRPAMQGGVEMIMWGVVFHILISLWWAFLFVMLWKRYAVLGKNVFATVLLYGLLIWIVMNVVVLPMSNVPRSPITVSSFWKGALILIVAVSLPIALITKNAKNLRART